MLRFFSPLMSAEEQYGLGLLFYHAKGLAKDIDEGIKFLELAADRGHIKAQKELKDILFQVGCRYHFGTDGTPQDLKKAAKYFQLAADRGFAPAQDMLGVCYQNGLGVDKDEKRAVELYQLSASQKDPRGQFHLAVCYAEGIGINKDSKRAIELHQLSANQGYALAQNYLGVQYYLGSIISKDYSQAVEFFKLAASQNQADALYNLGLCHEYGTGLTLNMKLAIECYEKAILQNSSPARCNLGVCYYLGKGVIKDPKKAAELWQPVLKQDVECFLTSANNGNAWSQYYLAVCFEHGIGVAKDIKRALEFYKLSVHQGFVPAKLNLLSLYGRIELSNDDKEVVEFHQLMAQEGNPEAQEALGTYYYNGRGVIRDTKKAIEFWQLATKQGNIKAQYFLYSCAQNYERGIGVPKDIKKALELYKQMANQGNKWAIERLNNIMFLWNSISKGNKPETLKQLKTVRDRKPQNLLNSMTPEGIEEPILLTLARFGHTPWLEEFLEYSRIDTTDDQGNTAIHIAISYGHMAFCDALIDQGLVASKPMEGYKWPKNKLGHTPLHSAAIHGQVNCIKHLVVTYHAMSDLFMPAINGDTIIHLLIRYRQERAYRFLLNLFPNLSPMVCIKNYHHQDPLMIAIESRDENLVKQVLEHQVDLANQDSEGRTALHLAVRQGLLPLVKLLVNKGSSLTTIDYQGKTPRQYASAEIDIYIGNYIARQQSKTHFHQKKSTWRNLVFQGGSVRGLACPGALRTLIEQDICRLEDIQRVGGTSAGAINALLVGLGYSLDEIDHLVGIKTIPNSTLPQINFVELLDGVFGNQLLAAKNHDWKSLLGTKHHETWQRLRQVDGILVGLARLFDGTVGDAIGLAKQVKTLLQDTYEKLSVDFGLCPGIKLETLFEDLIRLKVSEKARRPITTPVTFAELAEYQDFKAMYFVGINTETGEEAIFSHEHTPNMVVSNAVRISMSIPGVFQPQPAMTKDKNGLITKSKTLYVDGGILWNYPVELFDFARYGHNKNLSGHLPKINYETLGIRLVSSELKNRYEKLNTEGELTPEEISIKTFWQHITSLVSAIYRKQESDHARQGNSFRTIYIDTLDVGMLDFEKVESSSVKKLLLSQGKEGVLNFKKRQSEEFYHVKLPEKLEKAVLKYSKILAFRGQKGQQKGTFHINPNCPELVVEFYSFNDPRLYQYLHQELGVSLWARDSENNTALHIAAKQNNLVAIKNILAVDPNRANVTNGEGKTPLSLTNNKEIIALLQSCAQSVKSTLTQVNLSEISKKTDECQKNSKEHQKKSNQSYMKMPAEKHKSTTNTTSHTRSQTKQKQDQSTAKTDAEPSVTILLQKPSSPSHLPHHPSIAPLIFSSTDQAVPVASPFPVLKSTLQTSSASNGYFKDQKN